MKKQTIRTTVYASYLCVALMLGVSVLGASVNVAQAADNAVEGKSKTIVNQLAISNPVANYGVKVGDQLTRHISFSAPVPYTLTKKSLPKKIVNLKGLN